MAADNYISRMQIFRAKDAPPLAEAECMTMAPCTPVQEEGMMRLAEAGMLEGQELRVLVQLPGFSITHVWFKHGFPLPLHSHDADCLYYIVAGSLRLGTEELGPRDSFLIPADVPYTYKPGPDGVELLEIRHATSFNFVNLVKGAGWWERAAEMVETHREGWKTAKLPVLNG